MRRGSNLPHLTRHESIYAITFCLADSIPLATLAATTGQDEPSLPSQDALLDIGHGSCWLKQPEVASVVQETLSHFAGDRYLLLAWSLMPNHVHLILKPINGHSLSSIMHSIKRHSARAANEVVGRSGAFWQNESYDHLIRNSEDLRNQIAYAYDNPLRAGMTDWGWRGKDLEAIDLAVSDNASADEEDHRLKTCATEAPPPLPPAFAYIARRLGLDSSTRTLQLGSPFDYPNQATLYVEAGLPDPSDQRKFTQAAIAKIEHYLRHTHGGAFVLFTAFAMLRECADKLRPTLEHLGLHVLVQGVDGTPRQLLQRFRELDDAVLFGTSSFWQGIDVQGSKLRNVIIAKLPFAVPDEPLIEAKLEDVTRRGGNAFMDLSLPEAIIRFKQGFGRLIRSKSDKGIVVVLDPRVKTKRYGRAFLDALPDVKIVEIRE